jgi:hypothetical protein
VGQFKFKLTHHHIARRLAQHVNSGKFTQAEVDDATISPVGGGKLGREVQEQLKIDQLGGVTNLLNEVNPIGQARLDAMPEGYNR